MTPFQQRLKLRHVSVVIEIARLRSLQKAADALMVSQSAVSKALAEVETIVGAQLFERTPSGMQPTAFGETLVKHGYLILSDMQRAEAELDALRKGDTGNLSIGIFLPLGWWSALADCCASFRASHPRVRLIISEDPMDVLLERLDKGLLDIAIGRAARGQDSGQYAFDTLGQDHPLFVARQGHPHTEKPVTLEDLLGFPWVLPAEPNVVRQQLEIAVRDIGLRLSSDIVSSQVSPLVLRLASQSDTMILVSQCTVGEVRDAYGLLPVRCELPLNLGPLVAVTRDDKPCSAAAADFLIQLKSTLNIS